MQVTNDTRVSEALLLAETESLLDSLDSTAFTAASEPLRSHQQQPQQQIKGAKPRGRRSWKANPLRNPSRERLRSELAALRQQAAELEADLTLARSHREELERRHLLLLPVWERISRRQLDARTTSEFERRRLRMAVEAQRAFVAQLLLAWHRWQRLTALNPFASIASTTVRFDANDAAVFAMLASTLDLEHMRLHDVFHAAGLAHHTYTASTAQVAKTRLLESGETAPFLELGIVETDAYTFDIVRRAVRACLLERSAMRNRIEFRDVPSPERTRAVKVRVRARRGDQFVFLEELCVSRQYVEKNRTTTVWRTITREADGSEFPDAFVEETGWVVMTSMAGMDGAPFADGTLTLTCVHMEPKPKQPLIMGDSPPSVPDPFAEFVMDNLQSNFDSLNAMIDELLLETAVAPSPASSSAL